VATPPGGGARPGPRLDPMSAWQGLRIGASTGRLLVLLAALGGVFAMHGMSDHGTGGLGDQIAASSTSSHTMSISATVVDGERDIRLEVPAAPRPGHDHGNEVVGLCLAVLVAVVLLCVGLRRWVHLDLSVCLDRVRGSLTRFGVQHVPRPPDLLALSIRRC
jgi:hypothetical protein